MDPIYLDHNATTPVAGPVLEAMLPWLREGFGNPSSAHRRGRRAREAVEQARAKVAALIGAPPEAIVFTSGGTEANNLALFGIRHAVDGYLGSAIEHPATARPLDALEAEGVPVVRIGVDPSGRIDPREALDRVPGDRGALSVILAHNETGALQPVQALGRHKGPHLLHTDAAQAVGKIPVDVDRLGVDLLSLGGHKLYAPKGVGALYVRPGTPIRPLLRGAGHERGLRPGTENVASIVGLGVACELAAHHLATGIEAQRALCDRLLGTLRAAIPGLRLHGPAEARLPNTLLLGFPDATGAEVLAGAPAVEASTGSACHDGDLAPSTSLLAMGLSPPEALGAVRISLGRTTTEAQVDRAAAALIASWRALRGRP